MKQRKKNSLDSKYVLLIFVVICFILIGTSYLTRNSTNIVQSTVSSIVVPMQKGLNFVGYKISSFFETTKSLDEYKTANESLQAQIDDLKAEISNYQSNQDELDTLLGLLDMTERFANYNMVGARVISKDAGNWYNTFVIDKGSKDGIKEDMNVISESGLVGIVYQVGHSSSKVRAIIDDASSVSGMNNKNKDQCIVNGNLQLMNKGLLEIEMVSVSSDMAEGDEIVTSYISTKFLPGLPIGYATNIKVDESNLTQSAELIPLVDFERLTDVLIITQLKADLIDSFENESDDQNNTSEPVTESGTDSLDATDDSIQGNTTDEAGE